MTTTPEQAQASLERERHAYWIRKAAEKIRHADHASDPYEEKPPNRAQRRGHQYTGVTWSQRHRPAQPSNASVKAAKLAEARRTARIRAREENAK